MQGEIHSNLQNYYGDSLTSSWMCVCVCVCVCVCERERERERERTMFIGWVIAFLKQNGLTIKKNIYSVTCSIKKYIEHKIS
jgi:hypothetical protein